MDQKKSSTRLKIQDQSERIAHLGSWVWDVVRDKVIWSRALYRIFGITDKDFEGTYKDYLKFVHPDDLKAVSQLVSKSQEEHQVYTQNYRIIRPDGNIRFLRTELEVITNKQGKVEQMFGINEDVTEKKELEEKLVRLSMIAMKTINPVIITDITRRIEWVNDAFINLTGYSFEESIGKDMSDLAHLKKTDKSALKNIALNMRNGIPFEYMLQKSTKSGHSYWVEGQAQPIFTEDGRLSHYFNIETDITEKRKSFLALRKKESQTRSFAKYLNSALEEERLRISREIHDDLGQQLTGLKMSLASLKHNSSGKDQTNTIIDRMLTDMDTTIESLRSFASELRPGILDTLGLPPAIEWLVGEFERNSGINCQLNINVKASHFDQTISICFLRICQEALNNIVKHAEATNVSVSLSQNNRMLSMEITDNGRGIDKRKPLNSKSHGLLGMRERANLIGATLKISKLKPSGTSVQIQAKTRYS